MQQKISDLLDMICYDIVANGLGKNFKNGVKLCRWLGLGH